MSKSSFFDYSDAYILFKGTLSIIEQAGYNPNNINNETVFKKCAPFTDSISEISNTKKDNAKDIDVVMSMHNLIEYSDNYSKTSGRLWQYYRDEPVLTYAGAIVNFHAANNSASFKFKSKITGKTADGSKKDVEIMGLLKSLCNFWRTFEMALVNCEINLISTWPDKCVLFNHTKATTFATCWSSSD